MLPKTSKEVCSWWYTTKSQSREVVFLWPICIPDKIIFIMSEGIKRVASIIDFSCLYGYDHKQHVCHIIDFLSSPYIQSFQQCCIWKYPMVSDLKGSVMLWYVQRTLWLHLCTQENQPLQPRQPVLHSSLFRFVPPDHKGVRSPCFHLTLIASANY